MTVSSLIYLPDFSMNLFSDNLHRLCIIWWKKSH